MTPAATAEQALTMLYAAVDDRHLSWLDDLVIAAGLRHRCTNCHAMAGTNRACDLCGTTITPEPGVFVGTPAEPAPGQLITREQAENWARRPLSDNDIARLNSAIPHSSIPEAIETITASFDSD